MTDVMPLSHCPAGLLTLQQFMAHPVPMLPPGGSASAPETDRWVLHPSRLVLLEPEFTQQLSAIYNEAASNTEEYFRPVEFRGNLVQHAADSEGGVSAYFVQVAQAADDMLKQKGLTGVGHVCLATASVLSLALQQPQQQPSELPTVLGALPLDAGAAAAAWPGSLGPGTSSSSSAAAPGSLAASAAGVAAAEGLSNSHRSSSSNS